MISMANGGALIVAGLLAVIAVVYALVGREIAKRTVRPHARRPARDFTAWWIALAAGAGIQALQHTVASLSDRPQELAGFALATQLAYVLAVSVALTGLLSYLWYLYKGERKDIAIGVFYAVVYVAAAWTILARGITGFEVTSAGAIVQYGRDLPAQGLVDLAFFALFLVPQILGVIAYLSLRSVTREPQARRRILVVGVSLLLWIGSSLVAALVGIQDDTRWLLFLQLVSVGAALAILSAYRMANGGPAVAAVTEAS